MGRPRRFETGNPTKADMVKWCKVSELTPLRKQELQRDAEIRAMNTREREYRFVCLTFEGYERYAAIKELGQAVGLSYWEEQDFFYKNYGPVSYKEVVQVKKAYLQDKFERCGSYRP